MTAHSRKSSIACNKPVQTIFYQLLAGRSQQERRDRLLTALEQHDDPSQEELKACFHGLLTGYGVALKLW